MRRVGLDPESRKHVSKYSLGMRQRLGIAQAIMENPDILILDEPMNGLDNTGVQDIRGLLLELKAQGKTILSQAITARIFPCCAIRCMKWMGESSYSG